VIFYT